VQRDSVGAVLVTGGASGLGAAVAQAVEDRNGTPVVLDRVAPANGFAYELVDLSDGEAAHAATLNAIDRQGRLDAVVTCAGTDSCGRLEDVSWDDWERVVRVNLLGTAAVVHAALPALRESRGRVITVASTLGLRVLSDATAYCASKFGVVGFTRALAAELAGDVGVTLLIPGGMRTSFFDGREDRYKPPEDAQLNDPQHVAETVAFALSQPPGCEVRELVVTPSREPSWP
jgi:NAD(P)-dependent dehydrogenase (short-subunit alcohol dehydrogenase family)